MCRCFPAQRRVTTLSLEEEGGGELEEEEAEEEEEVLRGRGDCSCSSDESLRTWKMSGLTASLMSAAVSFALDG